MHFRSSTCLILSTLAMAVSAHAQTTQTSGAIRGVLRSKKGGPVTGAKVEIRNLETGLSRVATTDGNGAYLFSLLPVGPYEVAASAPGLKAHRGRMAVSLGETLTLNLDLDAAEVSSVVEVVAEAPALDPTSVATTATISEELIQAVPLATRDFTALAQLTPGATPNTQGYRTAIEGARGVMNNLMIDGTSYNSKFNGEQRGGTRIPFAFGIDSIRELQVITNPFDVQYGDASGGVINAITKSGTNTFEGTLFTQVRPGAFVAKMKPVPYDPNGTTNAPAARERNYSTSEYGFNVGGPIIKDKLHYFVNLDYVHFTQDSMPTVNLSPSDGTASDFNTFWGATGMGQNIHTSNTGLTLYQESLKPWTNEEKHLAAMGRLDWTINENHRATLRLNVQSYDASNDVYAGTIKNNIAESVNSAIRYQTLSWVAELNSILPYDLVNQALLQISTERRPETPNSTASVEIDVPGLSAGQYYLDPRGTDEFTTQVIDNLTWLKGDWTLKAGLDWQFIDYSNTFFPDGHGNYAFKSWGAANRWFTGAPTTSDSITYYQTWSNTNGHVTFGEAILAEYLSAQYAGLFSKRLTLNFGLRYTREMYDPNDRPNPKVQGLDQMPDNGSMDPRFGFTLDLNGDGKTVIRGGYGLFSVSNPAQNVSSAFMQNGQNTLPYKVVNGAATNAYFLQGGVLAWDQRIVNGYVTPIDPNALSPSVTPSTLPLGSVQLTLMDPRAHMAQSRNAILGIEHEFGNGLVLKARGIYKKFSHLQYFVDINLAQKNPATGNVDPNAIYNDGYAYANNAFSTTVRPGRAIVNGRSLDLSGYGAVGLSRFDGEGTYKAIVFEAERRSKEGFGFMSSLTLSSSRDSNSNERATAQAAGSNPIDPSNPLKQDRSDNDIPVRVVLVSYFPPVLGVKASATFIYASGYPWTPRYYADVNGDGYFNDPALGGRNSQRQPSAKSLNFKLARAWRFGGPLRLDTAIEVYNPFNWANQTTSQTTYDSSTGALNPAFGAINVTDKKTREVQVSVKFRF